MAKKRGEVDYEQFYLKNYGKDFYKKFNKKSSDEKLELISVPVIGGLKAVEKTNIDAVEGKVVEKNSNNESYEIEFKRDNSNTDFGHMSGKINNYPTQIALKVVKDEKCRNVCESLPKITEGEREKTSNPLKGKSSKIRSAIYALLLIIISFCATLLGCDFLTDGIVLKSVTSAIIYNSKDYDKIYYSVEIYEFDDLLTAKVYAEKIREETGAGYIFNSDNKYSIIGALYKNQEDASSVAEKMKKGGFEGAKVNSIPIKKINLSLFPESISEIVEVIYKYFFNVIERLYDISNDLDKELTDNESALINIEKIFSNLTELEKQFKSKTALHKTDMEIIRFKAQFNAVKASVENLLNANLARPNLLCDIRYTEILVAVTTMTYTQSKTLEKNI